MVTSFASNGASKFSVVVTSMRGFQLWFICKDVGRLFLREGGPGVVGGVENSSWTSIDEATSAMSGWCLGSILMGSL